jgi:predicted nucleic acid-binding protein
MSVLTLGELQKGVEAKRLNDPAGAQDVQAWLDGIEVMFSDRIVPIDLSASRLWGILSALRSRPTVDTLLAATALTRDLIFVTRNARDIQDSGVTVLNPWHV